ncbi:MAG: bifunctional riboflavin kinase/FAD synthetase [Saprospiraceae bacterium]|nr:bifunctional riboflavin kinase/FAD synthetase [Saprospiraceae bacterium]
MNIIRDLADLPRFRNAVVTTGSFDGVHAGHQKILARIQQLAREYDGESVVITFDPHPREVIYPRDDSLRLLTSTSEKLTYLKQYGVDNAVILPFTIEFSQMLAREYIERFLIEKFQPRCLVVGYNHQFGLNREGDFQLLQEYAGAGHFDLVRIDKHEIESIAISSSRIREAITAGQIEQANQALNHRYLLRGEVVHGEKIGKQIGYPTANLKLTSPKKLLPPAGIYAAFTWIDGVRHDSMLYIGNRPTVQRSDALSIEVHILDFDDQIYETEIDVELVRFMRPDRKLEDLEQLRAAIDADRNAVLDALHAESRNSATPIGVVALNYNGVALLQQYLTGWQRGSGQLATVYVADNASSDTSRAWLAQAHPDVAVIKMSENHGFAGGYNRALQHVNHKYLALINTDVEVTTGWLDPIYQFMEQHPDVAICQPKILAASRRDHFEYAGGCGGFLDIIGYPFCAGRILNEVEADRGQYDHLSDIFWSSGAAFVIRSEVFHGAGGFDQDYFAHQEEIDLCWTIKRAGYRIVSVPQSVVYHVGGVTLPYDNPRKVYLNFRNNVATLVKHLPWPRLVLTLVIRCMLDMMAAVNFMTQGKLNNALAVVKGYLHVIGWFPGLLRKRKALHRRIREMAVGPANMTGWLNVSILAQYYLMARRTFSAITDSAHVGQSEIRDHQQ